MTAEPEVMTPGLLLAILGSDDWSFRAEAVLNPALPLDAVQHTACHDPDARVRALAAQAIGERPVADHK